MFWRSFAKEIAALRRRLEVGDPAERRKVARELVDLCIIKDDPEDALPLLEELLNDADSEIAAAAGRGLSACAALAVEPLRRLLLHPQPELRARACDSLGSMQDEVDRSAAQPDLLKALVDADARVRGRAAFALGKMQDTARITIDALAAMAGRDADARVRGSAMHALGNIGQEAAAHASIAAHRGLILAALGDESDDMRWSAAYVLENVPLAPGQVLPRLLECISKETVERPLTMMRGVLHGICEREDLAPHLPSLLALAAVQPRVRATVYSICGTLGKQAASAAPLLAEALAREDSASVLAARALLAITGDRDQAIPVLRRMLEKPWAEAQAAAKLLLELGEPAVSLAPMLQRALRESPDEPCGFICEMGDAATSLGGALAPDLARAIDENFDASDWDLMWALTDALSALRSSAPEVVTALCRSLEHESDRVQVAAIRGLEAAGPAARAALPALKELTGSVNQAGKVARAAIRAIEAKTN